MISLVECCDPGINPILYGQIYIKFDEVILDGIPEYSFFSVIDDNSEFILVHGFRFKEIEDFK